MKLFAKNLSKKDSAVVVRELKKLEKKHGIITPKAVVSYAKPKTSPLHRYFTWDDTKAAEEYRLWQAQHLVARVFVRVTGEENEKPTLRAFVNIRVQSDDEEEGSVRGYVGIDVAKRSEPLRRQVLQYAHDQLVLWDERFGAMQEFFAVHEAIKDVRKSA